MGIDEKMQAQGGCPSGSVGRFFGFLMNNVHKGVYKFGLELVEFKGNENVLDIGCGGGALIKEMTKRAALGRVYGIDHSEDMVKLAAKKNRKSKNVEIKNASVSKLPFEDNSFDIVTAFETIQFWPDIENDLREVWRVLKPEGVFVIANRFPEEGSNWAGFLTFKNEDEYVEALNGAGFGDVNADTETKKGWIRIAVRKQSIKHKKS